ncbi:hypothetical protein FOMPIDRAFT_1115295 [Fomitopsis schrenkii]|uniref:Uncharacterized protein n=1 Tax=Fomitopsis schrenkii TaxID=2126942 RepID=S8EEV2_FOMSC|nr:hypothetical protein FOMPIDRAFT_1115295 [Fomitopsis schrenkii]
MTVHLWTLRHTDDGFQAHSRRLRVRHLQGVQSLAYRSIDNTLLSCGGSSIYSTDISVDQQTKPVKVTDGRLLQIHVHPQNPQVVVLEADQIENQVLVYDTRKGGFRHQPTLQFGHRSNPNAEHNTRFLKGSTLNSFFARPYNENDKGVVRVWDYRKATAVVACFKEEHSAPVVHAVLSGSDLLAYGGSSVTIWKTRSGPGQTSRDSPL